MRCWLAIKLNPWKRKTSLSADDTSEASPVRSPVQVKQDWATHKQESWVLICQRRLHSDSMHIFKSRTGDACFVNWVQNYLTKYAIIQCTIGNKEENKYCKNSQLGWLSSADTAEMEIESMAANCALIKAREGKNTIYSIYNYNNLLACF